MKSKLDQQLLDTMWKNPDNWKGIIYFNSKDPRLLVPKSNPKLGLTLNFGNKLTYLAFAGIVLIAVIYSYFY